MEKLTLPSWEVRKIHQTHDLAVVIGRFQPFHIAHRALVDHALSRAKTVLVLAGSSYIARNTRNPFSYEERVAMIRAVYPEAALRYGALVDDLYNDQQWIASVQSQVDAVAAELGATRICIVGHKKDSTSYYLDLFPRWGYVAAPINIACDATDIRNAMFGEEGYISQDVPNEVRDYLANVWIPNNTSEYQRLIQEQKFLTDYRSQYAGLAYPPIFVTTDAVVINNGHILLVRRGAQPGRGLWALPGGFVRDRERIQDALFRELISETRIQVNERMLRASLRGTHVFDAPDRSLRGRTITHAGLIVLNEISLPKVRGGDDAARARWMPISEFYTNKTRLVMYEDHWSVASYMINRVG